MRMCMNEFNTLLICATTLNLNMNVSYRVDE